MLSARGFIKQFAQNYQVPETTAEVWMKAILEFLGEQILQEDEVKLGKLGSFKQDYQFARKRYDINHHCFVDSPARMTILFVPSKSFEEKIRALPANPELARASKVRRREQILPNRREPESSGDMTSEEPPAEFIIQDVIPDELQ